MEEIAGQHIIRWYVVVGIGELIPRQSTMRGQWDYEAKCSCGWATHTGGATRRYISEKIEDHKHGY